MMDDLSAPAFSAAPAAAELSPPSPGARSNESEGTVGTESHERGPLPAFDRDSVVPGMSRRDDFALDPRRCALLVIDVQRHLCPFPLPGGGSKSGSGEGDRGCYSEYYQERLPSVLSNIAALLRAFRSLRDGDDQTESRGRHRRRPGCEVIFTYLQALTSDRRDASLDYELSGPLLASIPTAASLGDDDLFLPPPVAPSRLGRGDVCIPKTSCGTFASTNLDYVLRQLGIDQLAVVGQMTDQCVESAVREAADRGYYVAVASDACAATTQEAHDAAVTRLRAFARVVDQSDQLADELRDAAAARAIATPRTATAAAATMTDEAALNYLRGRGVDEAMVLQVAKALHSGSNALPAASPR